MADPSKPRYKFIKGRGDDQHQSLLNSAASKGYKATLMVYDDSDIGNNRQIVVLMENEEVGQ